MSTTQGEEVTVSSVTTEASKLEMKVSVAGTTEGGRRSNTNASEAAETRAPDNMQAEKGANTQSKEETYEATGCGERPDSVTLVTEAGW
jgi:hypothetical protein